jgi:hypothetical protein
MSDYHIRQADEYGNRFTVVFHVPIPDVDNQASINYRTAIVEWQGGAPIQSTLPSLGAEQTQLDAGELYEVVEAFNSNPNETLGQKQARLDARWTALASVQGDFIQDLQNVLGFWGYNRDVP